MTLQEQNLVLEIGDELERRLRKWGMIDGELQPLEERQRIAARTLIEQARRALSVLTNHPNLMVDLQGTIEQFEKEFKL